jgi:predicted trehalose synthase
MKKLLPFVLILGCASQTATPAPQAAANTQSEFKNLQVFPRDIPREQLLAAMRSFTRSLGVRCNHCHVVTATEPKEVLDFPSDAKTEKQIARVMLRMTSEINQTWMNRVEVAEGHAPKPDNMRVSCWTCHRGKTEPELPPPPPEPSR